MPTPLRRRIRHARRWFGYGALLALIALAVLVGIANQLLPMVERHPERIADWLSERVGEPVRFSHAQAEWTRRGPRFTLDGLRVGDGANELVIGRAQLLVAMYSGVLPSHPLTELKVRDLTLSLIQEKDGRWRVAGLPGQQRKGDPLDRLEGFGELQIEKAKLSVSSPRLSQQLAFPRVDVRLRVYGNRLLVGASAWASASSGPMSAVLDLRRDTRDGKVWLGGNHLTLLDWAPVLAEVGLQPHGGTAKLGVWLRLRDQRVDQATVEADINALALQATAPTGAPGAPGAAGGRSLQFDQLRATARWTAMGPSWRIDTPRFSVRRGKQVASLDGMQVIGGESQGLYGSNLDFSPLAAAVCLVDRVPAPLREFLCQAMPEARVREVAIHGRRGGRLLGGMTLSGLSLQPYRGYPGLSGLAGALRFDEHGGVMKLAGTPVRMNWPLGFRQPVDVRASGTLGLWKDGDNWTLGSNRLRLRGDGFGVDADVQLAFRPQGKPRLDLSATVVDTDVKVASKFWIMHKMPAKVVKWLDDGLISGTVEQARVVVGGELSEWPFRDGSGVFNARGTLRDASLRFDAAWPIAERVNLDIDFDGPGFSANGSGMIAGNRIVQLSGGIEDFQDALLTIVARSQGDAANLRKLMIASPLNREYGEHIQASTISGSALVDLAMVFPFGRTPGEQKIEGSLQLENAVLADSRWGIEFTKVKGLTTFSRAGFATQDLNVLFDNQPGVFNLAVGDYTQDRGVAAIAGLEGKFATAGLVNRYPELAWLLPRVSGSSDWRLGLRVPATSPGLPAAPAQLRVTSDMVGTTIALPAPLDKPESVVLALDLQMAVPAEEGEINLRLGDLMRFRGLLRPEAPMTGVILFGEGVVPSPTTRGLVVRGVAPTLDATGWSGTAAGGEGLSELQQVDLQVRQLSLLDSPFANTRVTLARAAASTQMQLKGDGIEGSVDVPNEGTRPVQMRFARLYLPAAKFGPAPAAAANTATANTATVTSSYDPTKLPPLRVNVADLRLGLAQLGQAELSTSPTDDGMRIDKFQTKSKNLSLDATGEWLRGGATSSSRFKIDFRAGSLGQMLDALGFGNTVQVGKTHATLTGQWPGSPGEFSLARFNGTLGIDIGEGRLLNVEPGGSGRIIGLISLTEIPRRLTLDFSDFFFKGFAFNEASGDFQFADGSARTDNLRINGPAAEIRITGITGFREQVYDQQVEVLPKAGGILPAIGMLAGGPAGIAVGVVAQAIMQKPLKQTTRVLYHVSGPWAKPQVDVVERGPKQAPAAPASSQ